MTYNGWYAIKSNQAKPNQNKLNIMDYNDVQCKYMCLESS